MMMELFEYTRKRFFLGIDRAKENSQDYSAVCVIRKDRRGYEVFDLFQTKNVEEFEQEVKRLKEKYHIEDIENTPKKDSLGMKVIINNKFPSNVIGFVQNNELVGVILFDKEVEDGKDED
jgi:hypothetical protein